MNDGDLTHDGALDVEEFTRLVTKVCGSVYLMSISLSLLQCMSVVVDVVFVPSSPFWRSLCCSLTSASPLLSMLMSFVLCQSALDTENELLPRMRTVLENVLAQVHSCARPFCAGV